MTPLSHDEAAHAVAAWLRKQSWCDLALTEIAGSYYRDRPSWPHAMFGMSVEEMAVANLEFDRTRKAWAMSGGGQLDVVGVSLDCKQRPASFRPRVAIVEVKVSMADLRADLRARKMLRYESQATECGLAVTAEVVGCTSAGPGDLARAVSDAIPGWHALGLPPDWAVFALDRGHRRTAFVSMVRPWERLGPRGLDATAERRARLAQRAAISLSYRYAALAEHLQRLGERMTITIPTEDKP